MQAAEAGAALGLHAGARGEGLRATQNSQVSSLQQTLEHGEVLKIEQPQRITEAVHVVVERCGRGVI